MEESGKIIGDKIGGFSINENRKGKAISKQTVANIIHSIPTYSPICEHLPGTLEAIYVMADEYKSVQGVLREDG